MAKASHIRERNAKELRRQPAKRAAYDRILIVCEGSKTEPNYFEEIRQIARIPSADVSILHSAVGTDLLTVVKFANTEFCKRAKAYERVYAVFDRDDHATYANAIHKAEATNLKNDEGKAVVFDAVVSVPNFELWFLLHFVDIQAFLHRDVVLVRLREHIPGYAKGAKHLYSLTKARLDLATGRATGLKARNSRLPGEQAYTDVHELVERLVTLRGGS